jgi:site-specific recombinase XerD
MCYKLEDQARKQKKFESILSEEQVPMFIKKYFSHFGSNTTKLTNWITIRQLLEWLHDKGLVKNDITNITTEELGKIESEDIMDFLDYLRLNNNKVSTVVTKKNQISGFWYYLSDKDYVRKNIVNREVNKKYKLGDKEVKVPTDEQINQFLSNLETIKSEIISVRNIAIVRLFLGTGIRIEELVGLDLDDLHFDDKQPYIAVMGKGNMDSDNKRKVLISKSAINAVEYYLVFRNTLSNIDGVEALFLSERFETDGKRSRVAISSIKNFFRKYSDNTLHPHLFRHYVGSNMYNSNKDIVGVANQLGHKDVKTSMKAYIKGNQEDQFKDLNNMSF